MSVTCKEAMNGAKINASHEHEEMHDYLSDFSDDKMNLLKQFIGNFHPEIHNNKDGDKLITDAMAVAWKEFGPDNQAKLLEHFTHEQLTYICMLVSIVDNICIRLGNKLSTLAFLLKGLESGKDKE